MRLIFHLSHPRNTNRGISVNAAMPPEKCSLHYPDFEQVIQMCIRAGVSCRISKSDMKSAFRNLGILRSHWRFLVMMAESPFDKKVYYFVGKCLPFGAAISCSHFQWFSNAMSHLVKFHTKKENVNYLDNFLFAALLKFACDFQMQTFLDICKDISFPVSMEKTFWGTTCLTFLGLLIDTVSQTVSIPKEKIERAQQLIAKILTKRKVTLKDLQKLCGFLNFLCKCIVPGRAFTRRLYAYTSGELKLHHHMPI